MPAAPRRATDSRCAGQQQRGCGNASSQSRDHEDGGPTIQIPAAEFPPHPPLSYRVHITLGEAVASYGPYPIVRIWLKTPPGYSGSWRTPHGAAFSTSCEPGSCVSAIS